MAKQYYYHNNNCEALHPVQKSCICWHDEGTGPLPEKCWSLNSPDSQWRNKPMNFKAAEAFKSASSITALYTRLDVARDAITIALDNIPKDFDLNSIKRINEIRNILSREMMNIWDLREAEEIRICSHEPQSQPLREITDPPAEYPPLADPDSLPDPPVLAGPDDNTPNFIQINLPNFF